MNTIGAKIDSSIINAEDNLELANYLNAVVKEFKSITDIHYANRGYCFIHSHEFLKWIEDRYPILYSKLSNLGAKVVDGLFQIDYPIRLPLDLNDLDQKNYEKFMLENEEEYYIIEDEIYERSEMIWEWVVHNMTEEEILSFHFIEHSWVEIGNLIIDFTQQQFRHAIDSKEDLKARYSYL